MALPRLGKVVVGGGDGSPGGYTVGLRAGGAARGEKGEDEGGEEKR